MRRLQAERGRDRQRATIILSTILVGWLFCKVNTHARTRTHTVRLAHQRNSLIRLPLPPRLLTISLFLRLHVRRRCCFCCCCCLCCCCHSPLSLSLPLSRPTGRMAAWPHGESSSSPPLPLSLRLAVRWLSALASLATQVCRLRFWASLARVCRFRFARVTNALAKEKFIGNERKSDAKSRSKSKC